MSYIFEVIIESIFNDVIRLNLILKNMICPFLIIILLDVVSYVELRVGRMPVKLFLWVFVKQNSQFIKSPLDSTNFKQQIPEQ